MYRTLRVAAFAVLVAATDASGAEPGNLECQATHTVSCEGVACRAEAPCGFIFATLNSLQLSQDTTLTASTSAMRLRIFGRTSMQPNNPLQPTCETHAPERWRWALKQKSLETLQ
jgi:hypothetical protein